MTFSSTASEWSTAEDPMVHQGGSGPEVFSLSRRDHDNMSTVSSVGIPCRASLGQTVNFALQRYNVLQSNSAVMKNVYVTVGSTVASFTETMPKKLDRFVGKASQIEDTLVSTMEDHLSLSCGTSMKGAFSPVPMLKLVEEQLFGEGGLLSDLESEAARLMQVYEKEVEGQNGLERQVNDDVQKVKLRKHAYKAVNSMFWVPATILDSLYPARKLSCPTCLNCLLLVIVYCVLASATALVCKMPTLLDSRPPENTTTTTTPTPPTPSFWPSWPFGSPSKKEDASSQQTWFEWILSFIMSRFLMHSIMSYLVSSVLTNWILCWISGDDMSWDDVPARLAEQEKQANIVLQVCREFRFRVQRAQDKMREFRRDNQRQVADLIGQAQAIVTVEVRTAHVKDIRRETFHALLDLSGLDSLAQQCRERNVDGRAFVDLEDSDLERMVGPLDTVGLARARQLRSAKDTVALPPLNILKVVRAAKVILTKSRTEAELLKIELTGTWDEYQMSTARPSHY
eukprot:TRINITY_DN3835_c0_g1_i1.p1 TRINITY_DN3835_c0_g1~~TRINITY_DN3835_c0_g1_i1.p1  ORF type:complete len:512 (-),score=70.22 TRINITY_DN3835_c0_g1_i1:260-1795(-)